jgi:hypothetical protein
MADSYIAIDEPAVTDKKLDTEQLTVGANTVERERMRIAGAAATDLAPVSGTDGLLVNLGANNDVTVSGVATEAKQDDAIALLTTIDADTSALAGTVSGAELQVDVVSSALPSGAATAAKQDTAQTALDAIKTAIEILDNVVSGSEAQVDIVAALPAGTALIGRANIDPQTGNGLTIFRSIDLDETEEEVKATAGALYGVWFSNLATTTRFLKFYNATAANVTVGTTTPVLTLALPGNTHDDISGVFSIPFGIVFDTAITVAATTGVADNDTGAPGANEVLVNIFYK